MRIMDAHAHIFTTLAGFGSDGELRAIGNGMARWATGTVQRIIPEGLGNDQFTAETYLSIMKAHGIEKAVLLQGGLLGFDNGYLKETMDKYPDRFISAAAIDPYCRNKEAILENLLKSFRIFKFESSAGCGLMGVHDTFRLDCDRMLGIYSHIAAIGGACVFDLGSPAEVSHQMDAIVNIAKAFPSMDIVVCHLGSFKQCDEELLKKEMNMVKGYGNISFDAAALMWKTRPEEYPFPIARRYLSIAKDIVGAERLMWGTDSPTMLCRYPMERLIDCFLPIFTDKEADLFFYQNANRIYFK